MLRNIRIYNCADVSAEDSVFINLGEIDKRKIEWFRYSGLPKYNVERLITRPRLSRYRAAYGCGIQAAFRGDILISHLPLMTAAVETTREMGLRLPPHLAFSFNFTTLPKGRRRAWQARRFQNIDQFCVYSAYEAELYSSYFDLPRSKFQPTFWTQPAPDIPPTTRSKRLRPLMCAVGNQGRDFQTLISVARNLPKVDFLVIALPPDTISDIPNNVKFRFGLSTDEVWRIANTADAILIILSSETTCCGQITIVSSQQCGMPIITTRSRATTEYTEDMEATCLVPARDINALALAVEKIADDVDSFFAAAERDRARANTRYNRKSWEDYVKNFIQTHLKQV